MLAMSLPAFDVPVSPLLEDSDWKRITSPRPPSSASAPSIFTIFGTGAKSPEPWPVPPERPSGLRVDCSGQSSLSERKKPERRKPVIVETKAVGPRSPPPDADVEDPRSPPHNTAPPNVEISAREIFDLPPSRTPGIVSSPDVMSPDLSPPPSFPRAQSFHFVDEENRPHTLRRRRAQMFELGAEGTGHRSPLDPVDAEAIMKALRMHIPVREAGRVSGGTEEGMRILRETVRRNEFDLEFWCSVVILLSVLLGAMVVLLAAET